MTSQPQRPADGGQPRHLSGCRRVFARRPTRGEILLGAPLWGCAMALSALASLYLRMGGQPPHLVAVMVLYGAGGLVSWGVALWMARLLLNEHPVESRFSAFFLSLTLTTIGVTAVFFALHYRTFYAQWHEPFPSVVWMFQFAFTEAGALYQFLVLGVRLYLPLGPVALILASLWLARKHDAGRR